MSKSAGHWYTQAGEPCCEVPKKNGNGTKSVTLREARELSLLPSVTTVIGDILARPGLEHYKVNQAILAGITLPRPRESVEEWVAKAPALGSADLLLWAYQNPPKFTDSDDTWAVKVAEDMKAQSEQAAEFGIRIHDRIAQELGGVDTACPPDIDPYLAGWREWATAEIEDVQAIEKVIVNLDWGYAGRMDLMATLRGIGDCVVDFKTQWMRKKEPVWYDEWPIQLAAYAFAAFYERKLVVPSLVSVVINSAEPGPVHRKVWDDGHKYWKAFTHIIELWKTLKNYNPTAPLSA